MAEIRSTLDLVMERTRNLFMSEEDKREQELTEFREGVNKLTTQYLDGEINTARFRKALQDLSESHPHSDRKSAATEIARRIDPSADNGPLLALIEKGCDFDVRGLEKLLQDYAQAERLETQKASERIRERLRARGFSGRAVMPDLAADAEFTARRTGIREKFKSQLAAQIDSLK